jgi:predicted GNAT family acetyltransferase
MKVIQNKSAQEFMDQNEQMLLLRESEHNLLLGLTDAMIRGTRDYPTPLFFTVMDGETIVGQAIRTSPDRPLGLATMPTEAAVKLAAELKELGVVLKGVVGPKNAVESFIDAFGEETNKGMHQGIYELHEVIVPESDGGQAIVADESHFDLVKEYATGFIVDCFPNESRDVDQDALEFANRSIKQKSLFLWQNKEGELTSMAARNRESKNAATISWVYTPPRYRKKGHASKVVAALSQQILADGKSFCNLFTDLSNPTSNSIYQKVGYRKVGESLHVDFC